MNRQKIMDMTIMNRCAIAAIVCPVLLICDTLNAGGQDQGITHKESKEGDLTVTAYYRGDSLILKKVTPPDGSLNTVYYVIHNGFEVLTYKAGPAGTEFAGAGVIRDMVKPDYTIKMAGDREGRIQRIVIYSPDFRTTYDGFRLKNHELIPWSAEELENWRKLRDSGDAGKP